MALLVVGSVAYDGIESPYGRVERTLGGAATYFAVAASFFTPVHLVGVVGDDFADCDAAIFRGKKIDCEGLERTVEFYREYFAHYVESGTRSTSM